MNEPTPATPAPSSGAPSSAASSSGAPSSDSPSTRPLLTRTPINRRAFLRQLAAVSAVGAGGYALASQGWRPAGTNNVPGFEPAQPMTAATGGQGAAAATSETIGRLVEGAPSERVLVIVDLQGGNDGLSTLVPAGDARYYDLRPNLAIPDDEVLGLDDQVGLHPSLARLHRRGVTTVEGVGPIDGDLSHFAMTERWQRGDANGNGRHRTGFLGRLIDAVDDGSPLVGVSLAGPTPYLLSQQAAAISIDRMDSLGNFAPREWADHQAWMSGVERYATQSGADDSVRQQLLRLAGEAYGDLLNLGGQLKVEDDEVDWDQPLLSEGGDLGRQLFLASQLVEADVGVRVVYAAIGGYDTHEGHQWRQAENLRQVDVAVDEFLTLMGGGGLDDQVLVATVSEFGRRVGENDSGLDHGTASTMLLAGPVDDQRLGERPDLGDLDADGNLKIPLGFDRYLASLAQDWLGVEADSVLFDNPEPLGIV